MTVGALKEVGAEVGRWVGGIDGFEVGGKDVGARVGTVVVGERVGDLDVGARVGGLVGGLEGLGVGGVFTAIIPRIP